MMAEHTLDTGEEDIFNAIYLKCFQKSLRPLYKSLISPKHSSTLFQQADPDRQRPFLNSLATVASSSRENS